MSASAGSYSSLTPSYYLNTISDLASAESTSLLVNEHHEIKLSNGSDPAIQTRFNEVEAKLSKIAEKIFEELKQYDRRDPKLFISLNNLKEKLEKRTTDKNQLSENVDCCWRIFQNNLIIQQEYSERILINLVKELNASFIENLEKLFCLLEVAEPFDLDRELKKIELISKYSKLQFNIGRYKLNDYNISSALSQVESILVYYSKCKLHSPKTIWDSMQLLNIDTLFLTERKTLLVWDLQDKVNAIERSFKQQILQEKSVNLGMFYPKLSEIVPRLIVTKTNHLELARNLLIKFVNELHTSYLNQNLQVQAVIDYLAPDGWHYALHTMDQNVIEQGVIRRKKEVDSHIGEVPELKKIAYAYIERCRDFMLKERYAQYDESPQEREHRRVMNTRKAWEALVPSVSFENRRTQPLSSELLRANQNKAVKDALSKNKLWIRRCYDRLIAYYELIDLTKANFSKQEKVLRIEKILMNEGVTLDDFDGLQQDEKEILKAILTPLPSLESSVNYATPESFRVLLRALDMWKDMDDDYKKMNIEIFLGIHDLAQCRERAFVPVWRRSVLKLHPDKLPQDLSDMEKDFLGKWIMGIRDFAKEKLKKDSILQSRYEAIEKLVGNQDQLLPSVAAEVFELDPAVQLRLDKLEGAVTVLLHLVNENEKDLTEDEFKNIQKWIWECHHRLLLDYLNHSLNPGNLLENAQFLAQIPQDMKDSLIPILNARIQQTFKEKVPENLAVVAALVQMNLGVSEVELIFNSINQIIDKMGKDLDVSSIRDYCDKAFNRRQRTLKGFKLRRDMLSARQFLGMSENSECDQNIFNQRAQALQESYNPWLSSLEQDELRCKIVCLQQLLESK